MMPTQFEYDEAAARMLGFKVIMRKWPKGGATPYEERVSYKVPYINDEGDNDWYWRTFTVANPADCLAAMECLMREHGVEFGHDGKQFWTDNVFELYADSLQELVGLAAIEVMKSQDAQQGVE